MPEQQAIRVENIQKYAIGRGGLVFPAGREIVVKTRNDRQYREIKACVYLKVSQVSDDAGDEDGTTLELSVEDALNALNKTELQSMATESGLDLPAKTSKKDLVAALLTASADDDDDNDATIVRLDALDEMSDAELQALLDAHEVEAPADATHEQLIGAIVASDQFQVEATEDDDAEADNDSSTPSTVTSGVTSTEV